MRTKVLRVRLTEEEWSMLEAMRGDVTASVYVRKRLFESAGSTPATVASRVAHGEPMAVPNPPEIRKPFWKGKEGRLL